MGVLGETDQAKFHHLQHSEKSDDDLPLSGMGGKELLEGQTLFGLKQIDKFCNAIFDGNGV